MMEALSMLKAVLTDPIYGYIAYRLAWYLWVVFDRLYYYLGGRDFSLIHGSRMEVQKSKEYESSAQLVRVYYQGKITLTGSCYPHNFIYKHIKYVHPREIVQDDSATLMSVGKKYCLFSVMKGFDAFNLRQSPFIYLSQQERSTHLYIVPTESFIRMAEETEMPSSKIVIVNMTARCGSTLVAQMFSRVPQVRVFSEPWCFNDAHFLFQEKKISLAQYKQLLRASYILQFKKDSKQEITHMVAKVTGFCIAQCPLIKELFPSTQYIFNTRSPIMTLKSFIKINFLQSFGLKITGEGNRNWTLHASIPHDEARMWDLVERLYEDTTLPSFEKRGMAYGIKFHTYLKNKTLYASTIIYEDLLTDPEGAMTNVFKSIDMDCKHIPLTLEALNHDSQNGLTGQRGSSGVGIPQEVWDDFDRGVRATCSKVHFKMSLDEFREVIEVKN